MTVLAATVAVLHTVSARAEASDTIPVVATKAGSFNTLLTAVTAADLAETLSGEGPFTVFAPTDAAFAALPEGTLEALLADTEALRKVLLYHVVAGKVMAADVVGLTEATAVSGEKISIEVVEGNVFVAGSQVVTVDVAASNGVIHVIDSVMLPPSMRLGNIVATAQKAGSFNSLLAAATAAGLAETLATGGPFTVFAPTDEAFAKLPEGTVEGLLANPDALKDILLYHVISGSVPAEQVIGLTSADTLLGKSVAIRVEDGMVFVNDAKVIATDVAASNGIIHVIDTVILPPND